MNGYEPFSPQAAKPEKDNRIESRPALGNLKSDDLILLGLIVLLLTEEECEDKSLLAILAILFLSGLE